MRAAARRRLTAWALLAPALVLLMGVFVVPSLDLLRLSLAWTDPGRTIHSDFSLANYRTFATSAYFHRLLWGSVKLTLWVTAGCLLLGYPAAWYMVHARRRAARTVLYAIVVSPLLISVIVRTYGWVVLLANNGVVNWALTVTGAVDKPVRMLGTFGSVTVASIHVLLPFMILPIASGLQDIDPTLARAAQNLGATPAQTFWRVTLPLSMPGVLAGTALVIALGLGLFITPLLVAGPLQPLLALGIYYVTLNQLDFPLGAALSFVLLIFTLLVLAAAARALGAVNRSAV